MKNMLLILWATLSFTLSSCKESMNKYDWIATECAPENYPVRIYRGNFFYGDDKQIYVPKGRNVNYGWGEDGSINIAGEEMKEAPHRLEITWLSYTENITYTGTFQLDRERIDSLFQQGYSNEFNAKETYNAMKVGMAPGGLVVVWISGAGKQLEVGHFQAKPTQIDWRREFPSMQISMPKYIKGIVARLPQEVQTQAKNHTIPVELWKNWRKRYSWNAVINKESRPDTLYTEYFNAEQTLNKANQKVEPEISHLAVPKRMYIFWRRGKLNDYMRTDIDFDEQEVVNAFSTLKEGEEAKLDITIDPEDYKVTLKLKSDTKEIILEKTKTRSVLR